VQHGIDANHDGKYDTGVLGESTLAKSAGISGVPEEATDPALCGMVSGAAAGSVPVGGVATGDGSTRHDPAIWFGTGGLALLAALGLFVIVRRRDFVPPRGAL
jgi:LPXTG-motif cell wall-anchored protein